MTPVFEKYSPDDFTDLCSRVQSYKEIDVERALRSTLEMIRSHKDSGFKFDENLNAVKILERRWYESLSSSPDFSVYDDPYYICDIWACWVLYSRNSLRVLRSPNMIGSSSFVDLIPRPRTVVDLGCGFGYTTSLLKDLFKESRVVGTNLRESYQFQIASEVGSQSGFEVVENIAKVNSVDLVVALEYFEHFSHPIDHLREILNLHRPRYLITANGFTGTAIGHFNSYSVDKRIYRNLEMGRIFSREMAAMGYRKLKTKIWNSRPSIWENTL